MTNDQCHWEQEQITLVPPYGSWETLESGRTVFWMPRSTSVGDVLVTREGVLYVVNDFGFRRVGRL